MDEILYPIATAVVLVVVAGWYFRPLYQSLYVTKEAKVPEMGALREMRERNLQTIGVDSSDVQSVRKRIGSPCIPFAEIFTQHEAASRACITECVNEPSLKNLHCMAKVLDNILQNTDTKYQRIGEDNERLRKDVLSTDGGERLVELCGFALDDGAYVWNAADDDSACLFRTLVTRAAIGQMLAFARAHGTRKWTMGKAERLPVNYELVPNDILMLKDCTELDQPSMKERYLENQVRQKLVEMRPLHHRDAVSAACRRFTSYWRGHHRGQATMHEEIPTDVLVQELTQVLPPGVEFAHMCWNGNLPHCFGASNTRSKEDSAMDQIVAEAVGNWRTVHREDLDWMQAHVFGVASSLDYSANAGFLCAVIAGFPFPRT